MHTDYKSDSTSEDACATLSQHQTPAALSARSVITPEAQQDHQTNCEKQVYLAKSGLKIGHFSFYLSEWGWYPFPKTSK